MPFKVQRFEQSLAALPRHGRPIRQISRATAKQFSQYLSGLALIQHRRSIKAHAVSPSRR